MEELLQVGAISSTHGVHGEVKVYPMTDDVKRFKKLKNVLLDYKNEKKELEIEGVKFFKNMVILKFKGYDNINDIEKYKGCSLFVTRENAVRLRKNEYFIADLIDIEVRDEENVRIGKIDDVMLTGANDVYVISMDDGRELLLPAIKECVLDVNVEEGYMIIHILEGLLD